MVSVLLAFPTLAWVVCVLLVLLVTRAAVRAEGDPDA